MQEVYCLIKRRPSGIFLKKLYVNLIELVLSCQSLFVIKLQILEVQFVTTSSNHFNPTSFEKIREYIAQIFSNAAISAKN